jgi:hypothetical protein
VGLGVSARVCRCERRERERERERACVCVLIQIEFFKVDVLVLQFCCRCQDPNI